jgi:hypothetical protein
MVNGKYEYDTRDWRQASDCVHVKFDDPTLLLTCIVQSELPRKLSVYLSERVYIDSCQRLVHRHR